MQYVKVRDPDGNVFEVTPLNGYDLTQNTKPAWTYVKAEKPKEKPKPVSKTNIVDEDSEEDSREFVEKEPGEEVKAPPKARKTRRPAKK